MLIVWKRRPTPDMEKLAAFCLFGNGGWDYSDDDVYRPDVVSIGYEKGVPMGGDLPARPASRKAPTFMVGAAKDVA